MKLMSFLQGWILKDRANVQTYLAFQWGLHEILLVKLFRKDTRQVVPLVGMQRGSRGTDGFYVISWAESRNMRGRGDKARFSALNHEIKT